MRSLIALALLSFVSILATGCATCTTPHDCDYPTYGGRWDRTNRTQGRVGSAFDPAGGPTEEVSSSAVAEPTPADTEDYLPEPGEGNELPMPPGY